MSVWIISSRLFLIYEFWGETLGKILLTATTMSYLCFLCLVLGAFTNCTLRFEPSSLLCYVVVGWAFFSTAVLIECDPSTWESKVKQAQAKLIDAGTDLVSEFMEITGCTLEGERNCWEEIKFYVDKKFIVFAQCFVILYPLILGTSIVYVIT